MSVNSLIMQIDLRPEMIFLLIFSQRYFKCCKTNWTPNGLLIFKAFLTIEFDKMTSYFIGNIDRNPTERLASWKETDWLNLIIISSLTSMSIISSSKINVLIFSLLHIKGISATSLRKLINSWLSFLDLETISESSSNKISDDILMFFMNGLQLETSCSAWKIHSGMLTLEQRPRCSVRYNNLLEVRHLVEGSLFLLNALNRLLYGWKSSLTSTGWFSHIIKGVLISSSTALPSRFSIMKSTCETILSWLMRARLGII